jgi:hypothetical protein
VTKKEFDEGIKNGTLHAGVGIRLKSGGAPMIASGFDSIHELALVNNRGVEVKYNIAEVILA